MTLDCAMALVLFKIYLKSYGFSTYFGSFGAHCGKVVEDVV